jgi:hypothetical protein
MMTGEAIDVQRADAVGAHVAEVIGCAGEWIMAGGHLPMSHHVGFAEPSLLDRRLNRRSLSFAAT